MTFAPSYLQEYEMTVTYVMTDIHGMYDLLLRAAAQIPADAKVICLGDYIDRGPDGAKVVQFLRAKQKDADWVILKGNHEDMMVHAMDSNDAASGWLLNGGGATLASYGMHEDMQPDVDWMKALPTIHEDEHRTYVHATHHEGNQRIWGRYGAGPAGHSKHVVHGHTPHRMPEFLSDRTNLDTGACYPSGCLTVGVFHTGGVGPSAIIQVHTEGK